MDLIGFMKLMELCLRVPLEYVEPVAELFRRCNPTGIAIELPGFVEKETVAPNQRPDEAILRAYLPLNSGNARSLEKVRVGVQLISALHPLPRLQERILEAEDWEEAWKAHFTLLRVGKRLVIRPSWQEYTPKATDIVVELDPGLAFGTGYHPTTYMCLEALEDLASDGMTVLDVGTGSGILAIAAAKIGAWKVVGVDMDPIAVKTARANSRINGVAEKILLIEGELSQSRLPQRNFDLVLANLHARVLRGMASKLMQALHPNGMLIASGILQRQLSEVEETFAEAGLVRSGEVAFSGDWVALPVRHKGL